MEVELTSQEKQRIENGILEKYIKVAVSPEGQFRYPTGRAGLEALNYDPEILQGLPEPVAASYCGVGNPFSLGLIRQGENVIFIESSAELLPFPDKIFDVVISNGVFNLLVDKIKALKEVFRVLKPDGRFMLADQVLVGELPKETGIRVESWFR